MYHINAETGRLNICRAKTPESCPLKPPFGEDDTPHFTTKEEGRVYAEAKLAEEYSPTVGAKKDSPSKESIFSEQLVLDAIVSTNDFIKFHDVYEFQREHMSDYTLESHIPQIDGQTEVLLVKGDSHVLARFYEDDWTGAELLTLSLVNPATAKQIATNLTEAESTGPEIFKLIKEYDTEVNKGRDPRYPYRLISEDWDNKKNKVFFTPSEDLVIEREDGSKLYSIKLVAPGDSSVFDKPYPVQLPIELYENGERQNGREFDSGAAFFDTRTGEGYAFVYRSGSEMGGEYRFKVTPQGVRTKDSTQTIYKIEGTGETVDANYYKLP